MPDRMVERGASSSPPRLPASELDADPSAGLRIRQGRRTAVVRFRRSALDAATLETVLNEAVDLATRALDVQLVQVLEYDAASDRLTVRATHGWATDMIGRVIEHAQETSEAAYVLRTGHAIVVEDLRRVDAFRSTQSWRESEVISGATVVIHGQVAPWGVLSVQSTKRRMLTTDELDFLQAVADVIAAAAYRFLLARRREGLPTFRQSNPGVQADR